MNNKLKYFIPSFHLVLAILLFSCSSQKINQLSNDRIYKKANNELEANYMAYHINDSLTQFYIDISNEKLIYKKTDTSDFFYSVIKLQLKIYRDDNLRLPIDTTSTIISDKQNDIKIRKLKNYINLKLYSNYNYQIEVNALDVNKKIKYTQTIAVNKQSKNSQQNFLFTNTQNEILFSRYSQPQSIIYLESERNIQTEFTVDFFKSNFEIAIPPFSLEPMPSFNYKPDSTFLISKNNNKINLTLPKKGFLHVRTNPQSKEGVSFFAFESTFPKIKNNEQMILATRYIMSKKEFDYCANSNNKKEAIDNFWLEIGGSNERARELIKKYYGRVQESNKLFTSYMEGWKTDRGMIYIVFGAPNNVIKYQYGETWIYGIEGNPSSTVFSFVKVINPFSDNDFYLERKEYFKTPWYQAVDSWRQGRIFLDN